MSFTFSQRTRSWLALISGALIALSAALWLLRVPDSLSIRLTLLFAASLIAGFPIAVRAIQALRFRAFSIDLLVTVAVIGALIIGEFVEAAVVSFLFLFGAWLEARSLERTRASLNELIDLAPTQATVVRDGERVQVSADEVLETESVIVMSGERIAIDGIITEGEAEVSEASITGEPTPVTKRPGDRVFAGTIAESGFLTITAERVGAATTFARMIELVEEAQESKTKRQRFLDRFAQYYTPAIIILAVVVFIWSRDLSFALTFLVIACPGALVISVPVAAVAGLGNIARNGVLVKDAESLEQLAQANTLVVDKTGTLTIGKPVVTRVQATSTYSAQDLLLLAASAESASEHHAARAIVAEALEQGITLDNALSQVTLVTGVGVSAHVANTPVVVGRRSLLAERGIELAPEQATETALLEEAGSTVVYVAIDGAYAGFIEVTDRVRPEAAEALATLRRQGIKQVVMLTGDNPHSAQRVADALGIDQVHSGLLPEDKVQFVSGLQAEGAHIAMIGDGVNDAAALATSNVGIAMGDSGTDISVETADVVLLTGRLDQFAHAHRVARATVRIMKQNMALALGTVALLIAGVFLHVVHLASGMLIHEISVLLVIVNALRLSAVRHSVVDHKTGASTSGDSATQPAQGEESTPRKIESPTQ